MGKINYWQKFQEGGIYHLYNRGINGTKLFRKEENYHFFLRRWKQYLGPIFDVFAYCLMPNHFHFLIRLKPLDTLPPDWISAQRTRRATQFINSEIEPNDFIEDQFKRLFRNVYEISS